MLAYQADMPAKSPQTARGKVRLCTVESIDQRTRGAKRVAELVATFEAELSKSGRTVTAAESAAIRNAALLSAISEDAAARRLAGDATVSLEDVVRLSRASAAAVRALGFKPAAAVASPLSVREYFAAMPAARAGASNSHHEASADDGEASGDEGAA